MFSTTVYLREQVVCLKDEAEVAAAALPKAGRHSSVATSSSAEVVGAGSRAVEAAEDVSSTWICPTRTGPSTRRSPPRRW